MPFTRTVSASAIFYPELNRYLTAAATRFDAIPNDRKTELAKVADYIRQRLSNAEPAKLTFICTHNSRRSHLSQIWAQVAAEFYGLCGVETFSGGTEATAFNPRAVAALQRCGLKIVAEDCTATNPRYRVSTSDSTVPQVCFSKAYGDPPNPSQGYCAVMTCSQADDACPLVMGCELRMPIRYEDPKVADDTELESQRYDERTAQICTEMLYLMSRVN
jgi:arsenate reductase